MSSENQENQQNSCHSSAHTLRNGYKGTSQLEAGPRHPNLSVSSQAVELEEAVLGAVLLDPEALPDLEQLPIPAFSISAHRQIFRVMLGLGKQGLKPDLPTVAYKLAELGTLQEVGGQAKLASLLGCTVHSANIKQYARLLQEQYYRHFLTNSFSQIARLPETEGDFTSVLRQAQSQLDHIRVVTHDSLIDSDAQSLDLASFSITVTSVNKILEQGLSDWKEQAHLDALQAESGLSKPSFAHLVAAQRCHFDEVTREDQGRFNQLVDWHNAQLNFKLALPHLADDLLHDAAVLNVDPISLWQYFLPATLSLVGKKCDLDVQSHKVPAIAWTCTVGESGTGKSRAEGLLLAPLKEWQQQEFQRFSQELKEYKKALNNKEESEPGTESPIPERKYLFEVATIQAVMRRLYEQAENGSLWARDEIAGLFKSLNQFTPNGDGEGLECLLKMWDGSPTQVDRVLYEDSYNMLSTRLSLAGGLQPGIFHKIFKDADDANGMQARFLFALPKIRPAKRVKGACRLSDRLPHFYRWVDQEFPAGTVRLSRAADSRYDAIYEQIGIQAEQGRTPAIRVWMRKLSGQLLRIALALHIVECYHEPGRPKHEIQLDTLNRAVEVARYYRSVFQAIQEIVGDSDETSSILLKIWDMAATSPTGVAVRDTYRRIKAIQRRAKELGRDVAAYTIDLYQQLEKMGRGVVQKDKRLVRFMVRTNPINPPLQPSLTESVTVVTDVVSETNQSVETSHLIGVSPVTVQDSLKTTITNETTNTASVDQTVDLIQDTTSMEEEALFDNSLQAGLFHSK